MIVIFDIQHFGQPGRHRDSRGAHADLDGDGKRDAWEFEAAQTPFYAASASMVLAEAGIPVCFMPIGLATYPQRAQHVIDLQERTGKGVVVILCHLNAGNQDNAIAAYHDERLSDRAMAEAIQNEFRSLAEVGSSLCLAAQPSPHWTSSMRFCLEAYAQAPKAVTAVLVEPWFLDNPKHQSLAGQGGPMRVGKAIADAIIGMNKKARNHGRNHG